MKRRDVLALGGGAAAAIGIGAALTLRSTASMADYDALARQEREAVSPPASARDLVRLASLAPNSHNTQPWRFEISEGRIAIRPDFARRTPAVDPDDHHLFVSLGAAAETLSIAAAATGLPGTLRFEESDGAILFDFAAGLPVASQLFNAIAQRQSTRAPFDGMPLTPELIQRLVEAAAIPGVRLIMLTAPAKIAAVGERIIDANTIQMTNAAFRAELKHWIRFSPDQAIETRDGLFAASSGNPTLPPLLGNLLFDLVVRAGSENERYRAQLATTPCLAIIVSERDDRAHWVAAGQACQRLLLQATALGLKQSFVNQAVEVPEIRPLLAADLGVATGERPDLIIRLGYGPELPRSLRRPAAAVINEG
ncbi:nitroreductase family protein [Kaistia geumhonensis]|uniref:Nitroreductase n=1 Tax=Kaistia geumhonensis TaxID=410839 RepID=A0ABU0M7G6_9HYPH|nr:nitroreductase family protein [Kaistia geumhonensis]MCX5477878.1 nitroreductase family protein [Kaistia geumhonensis]MDQ0516909.1 nitroreductase [Kaistia geumhonensis]